MKYRHRQKTAAVLAAVMLITGGGIESYGAEPQVMTDETMYVNLDYYGTASKVNVVKGCSLNGITEFTDFGNYTKVVNMSGQEEPQIQGDAVTWKLPKGTKGRFYYQCGMDESQVELPWTFDVSYKLNGVPISGEELAGASGLVEIHITADPNEKASLYYRNNMMLMVAVPADLTKCYSVEAEGSQTQNLGDTTAVVFSALPGEEGDYTVRIGTDSFETTGVIMAMVPGTVNDLEHIKDLKEAKDTWQDAGDELYDSLEQMARSVEAMRDGVNQIQSGLASADAARETWSGAKDQILAGNDETLAALSALSSQMETMVPHLQTAKDTAEVIHNSMGDLVDTMGDMQEPLRKLQTRLENIKSSTGSMAEELPALQEEIETIIGLDARLQANEQAILTGLKDLPDLLDSIEMDYYDEEWEEEYEDDDLIIDTGELPVPEGTQSNATREKKDAPIVGDSGDLTLDAGELMQLLQARTEVLEKVSEDSKSLTASMSSLLDNTSDSAKYSSQIVDDLDFLIEDLRALHDSLDMYYPDLQAALDDSKALVNCTTEALNSGISTMSVLQNTLKASSDQIDAAARESLRGSMELLDKSLGFLDSTSAMRQAGATMKDVMDRELDKFDTENRFLFMDPSAEKESFTSAKNQAPNTLQIILRTDEISLDDEEAKTADAEVQEAVVSPLKRMWNVLVKMWQAIVEVFKNR